MPAGHGSGLLLWLHTSTAGGGLTQMTGDLGNGQAYVARLCPVFFLGARCPQEEQVILSVASVTSQPPICFTLLFPKFFRTQARNWMLATGTHGETKTPKPPEKTRNPSFVVQQQTTNKRSGRIRTFGKSTEVKGEKYKTRTQYWNPSPTARKLGRLLNPPGLGFLTCKTGIKTVTRGY